MTISKDVALDACLIQQKVGLIDSKIPVLVGKTSSGKTYWVQNELSKQLNLPVVKILLQNEQPDEILGYPKFMGNDTLEFLKPAWWTERPSIFFFDELDKSREELHASILTLLREGTIRGRQLPTGSVIICAMNESDYLSDPLKARCIFLPFEYKIRELQDNTLSKVADYMQTFVLPVELPNQANVPENIHYLTKYQELNPNILDEHSKMRTIVEGLFPANQVLPIVSMVSKLNDLDYSKLLKDNNLCTTFVNSLTNVHDAHKHFIEFLKVMTNPSDTHHIKCILTRFSSQNIEDLVKFYELTHDAWLNDIPNIGNHKFEPEVIKEIADELRWRLREMSEEINDKIRDLDYSWEEPNESSEDAVSESDSDG